MSSRDKKGKSKDVTTTKVAEEETKFFPLNKKVIETKTRIIGSMVVLSEGISQVLDLTRLTNETGLNIVDILTVDKEGSPFSIIFANQRELAGIIETQSSELNELKELINKLTVSVNNIQKDLEASIKTNSSLLRNTITEISQNIEFNEDLIFDNEDKSEGGDNSKLEESTDDKTKKEDNEDVTSSNSSSEESKSDEDDKSNNMSSNEEIKNSSISKERGPVSKKIATTKKTGGPRRLISRHKK